RDLLGDKSVDEARQNGPGGNTLPRSESAHRHWQGNLPVQRGNKPVGQIERPCRGGGDKGARLLAGLYVALCAHLEGVRERVDGDECVRSASRCGAMRQRQNQSVSADGTGVQRPADPVAQRATIPYL